MAKRPLTAKQKAALAKGRAALKRAQKARRKSNPLKNGYSAATVSDNIAKLRREGYPAARASAAALRSARNAWRVKHPKGAYPDHLKTKRKRNPGPPTRGAVMVKDLPGLTAGTAGRQATQQSVAKRVLKRYPQTTTRQQGFRTNPPHYCIKCDKGYFDGAGFSTTKNGAAQYMTKQKAATIGQKIADKTGKPVAVVAV